MVKHHGGTRLTDAIDQSHAVPIGDYGFLSDGEVAALVSPGGSVDWMCLPRFDSPSVFGAVLGQRAGSLRIAPLDARVPGARRYLPGHDGARDQLGNPDGLDDRPRRPVDRAVAPPGRPLGDVPPDADRLRGRACPAAHHPLRVGGGADAHGLRAGARLWAGPGALGVHGRRLPPSRGHRRRHGHHRHPDHRHAARARGWAGQRADAAQGG